MVDDEIARVTLIDLGNDSITTQQIEPALWRRSPRFVSGVSTNGSLVFIPFFIGFRPGGDEYEPSSPSWVQVTPVHLVAEGPSDAGVVLFSERMLEQYWNEEFFQRHPLSGAWVSAVHHDQVALVGALGGDILVADLATGRRVALNVGSSAGLEVSDGLIARVEQWVSGLEGRRARRIAGLGSLRDRGYPDRVAFFDRLVSTREGSLWVRRKEDQFGLEWERWEVTNFEGEHLGTVSVRSNEDIVGASRGIVVTHSVDELGTPLLRVYGHPFDGSRP